MPIDEVKNLRTSQQRWKDLTVDAGKKYFADINPELLDLSVELKPEGAAAVGVELHGEKLRYSVADRTISLGSVTAPLRLSAGVLRLRILVDRSSLEVFAEDGQVSLSAITLRDADRSVAIVVEGGAVRVPLLEANGLESIWPDLHR